VPHQAPIINGAGARGHARHQAARLRRRVYPAPAARPHALREQGIWSLLKRSMASFAVADQAGLLRIIKRKLKNIQYRPHLINGCLAATGVRTEPS
jgi:hypothetical protein